MSNRDTRYYLSSHLEAEPLIEVLSARTGWEATNTTPYPDARTDLEDIVAAQVVIVVALRNSMEQWVDMGIALGAEKRVILVRSDSDLTEDEMPEHCSLDEVSVVEGDFWTLRGGDLADVIVAALEGEEDEDD